MSSPERQPAIQTPEVSSEQVAYEFLSEAEALGQQPSSLERDQQMATLYKQIEAAFQPEKVSPEQAERIMGVDFLGPKAIKDAFGIEVTKAPAIQFSLEELERAQELGQQLILFVDKTSDGSPLTMEKMNELREGKSADGKRLLYNISWCEDEPFFQEETPVFGWRLVSPEIIPNSERNNYINQMQIIADYLTNEVYKGKSLPDKYQEAIAEFQEQKAELTALLDSNLEEAGEGIEWLQITAITREDAPSAFYRLIIAEKKSGEKSLLERWSWTSTRSSDGYFVDVGDFGGDGVHVNRSKPNAIHLPLGVCLSRS